MNNKVTRQNLVKIVNAVRAGIAATAHHQKITSRVYDAIKVQLVKAFPGTTIHQWVVGGPSNPNLHEGLTIWGGTEIAPYLDRVLIYGRNIVQWSRNDKSWSEGLLDGCKRDDVTDCIEREATEQEPAHQAFLADRNAEANELLKKLAAVRERAKAYIGRLPIPAAAVAAGFRNENVYWNEPSETLKAQFPAIFNA